MNNLSSNSLNYIEELTQSVTNELIDELFLLDYNNQLGDNPASQQIIDNLDVKINNEERCCSICLEKIKKKEKICELECNHIFHSCCVTKWLKVDNSCPVCRKRLTYKEKLKDFYFITIFYPDHSILYKSFRKNTTLDEFVKILQKYTDGFINPEIFLRCIDKNKIINIDTITNKSLEDLGFNNKTKIKIYY